MQNSSKRGVTDETPHSMCLSKDSGTAEAEWFPLCLLKKNHHQMTFLTSKRIPQNTAWVRGPPPQKDKIFFMSFKKPNFMHISIKAVQVFNMKSLDHVEIRLAC